MGRFSPVASARALTLRQAVERYLAALERGGGGIDGVPVNWRA